MRWPSTLLTGAICAIGGGLIALLLGDTVARAWRVSNMEGGRGYLVVFVFVPIGLLVGLIVGIVVARLSHGTGPGAFFKAQGVGLLFTGAAVGGLAGLAMLVADRPLTKNSRSRILEFEIRIPTDQPIPEDLKAANLRASLYEGPNANQYADLGFGAVARQDSFVTVPGTVALLTRNSRRMFSATLGESPSHVWDLLFVGETGARDTTWSEWIRNRDPLGDSEARTGERYQLRYRIAPVAPTT